MAKVILLPLAEADLQDVWSGIAIDSPKAADRIIERIVGKIDVLGQFPEMGQLRPDLGIAIRVLIEHPYIVPYRYQTENLIEIIRVLHGARELTDALDGL